MVLMKRKGIIAIAISTLALAGCSSSNEVDTVEQVVEPLADTPWACVNFTPYDPEYGVCEFEFTDGKHAVHVTDDPELMAAVGFDVNPDVKSIVLGDNWTFACDYPMEPGDCDYVAGLLGGEMIERGHWSE